MGANTAGPSTWPSTACAHSRRRVPHATPGCPQEPVDNGIGSDSSARLVSPGPVRERPGGGWSSLPSEPGRSSRSWVVALSQLVDSGEASWTAEPPTSYGESQETYGGRMPPQDADAEQSVLGAMMLSKDAIADVNERIKGGDFYRPAHESIYDAIVELYAKGEPADPVTVVAELNRRGELARVGGAPYLHTLTANVPIATNASFYA